MNVEEEIQNLVEEIHRRGSVQPDGSYKVIFGVLLNDEERANNFDALVEALIAAKERKIVSFLGELLLENDMELVHIEITLPSPPLPPLVVAATS